MQLKVVKRAQLSLRQWSESHGSWTGWIYRDSNVRVHHSDIKLDCEPSGLSCHSARRENIKLPSSILDNLGADPHALWCSQGGEVECRWLNYIYCERHIAHTFSIHGLEERWVRLFLRIYCMVPSGIIMVGIILFRSAKILSSISSIEKAITIMELFIADFM